MDDFLAASAITVSVLHDRPLFVTRVGLTKPEADKFDSETKCCVSVVSLGPHSAHYSYVQAGWI